MQIHQVSSLPPIDAQIVAIDIETTTNGKAGSKRAISSDPYNDKIVSLQVSDGEDVWILKNNHVSAIPLLTNPNVKKVGQNLSFDIGFLRLHLGGIEIDNIFDTLMAERLLNSGKDGVENSLDDILARRLGIFTDKSIRSQFSNHQGEFTQEQLQYMATDVAPLLKIRELQLEEISKAGMGRVLALENAVVPVVAQMQLDGIGFDLEQWRENLIWFGEKKQEIKHRVASYLDIPSQASLFGEDLEIGINLNSSDQVKNILRDLGLVLGSTGEAYLQDALESYEGENGTTIRFIRDVLEWRGFEKLIGYGYHNHINPITGRIHCSWNQNAAQTGRFSCSEPNLQQVRRPVAGEPNLRAMFIPDEGDVFVIADYSQQEPRVLAQLVGDPAMLKAASETDMYTALGEQVYNRKITKKDEERNRLKVAALAYFYGAYPKKLAYVLGVSLKEAEDFVNRLNTTYPKAVQSGVQRVQQVAQRGYVSSLYGRRCWLLGAVGASKDDMWRYRNQALNAPVQMSSADITKLAMSLFYSWTKENGYDKARIRLQVHDELVVSCPAEQAEEVQYNLVTAMETAMETICPSVRSEVESHIDHCWSK